MNTVFVYKSEDQNKNREGLSVRKTSEVIKELKEQGYEVLNYYNNKKN